jgi:POT family proton-dependent oligopeptide transporter
MKERKHPKALPYLFLSEMWERFGYYLMIGIFTLYLKDKEQGFGLSEAEASDLYGTFIALVFLTPFIGGLLADRILGYRKAIIFGGILMGIGYSLMGIHSLPMLYTAMTFIIVGNGFFKPNISTLLGNVYNEERYRAKKDEGYNIFYMGINIGAFICNFFGAFMYNILGWEAAFITAGIGMFIGVVIFWLGTNHFKHADVIKPMQAEDMSLAKISGYILLPAALFGVIGYFLNGVTDKVLNPDGNFLGSDTTDAFILACIPVIIFYARIWFKASTDEKKPIGAMLTIFAVVIAFWAVFKQNGSTLNTWADRYTDREVPAAIAPTFQQLKLVQEIPYTKDSVDVLDNQFRETGKTAVDYPSYYSNMKEDKLPNPGETVYAFNTNLFQSVNPFWVIILTPLVVAFFTFLRYRQKEPSTPTKIFFGLFITALSCLVMVAAVYESGNGAVKASPWWFIASYGVLTIGELCLSPMGLSLVSKLSPPRLTALMMGGWFLATSIGNKLSGVMSSMWDKYDQKANFFWVNFVLLLMASALLLLVLKRLNKVFKQHI